MKPKKKSISTAKNFYISEAKKRQKTVGKCNFVCYLKVIDHVYTLNKRKCLKRRSQGNISR